MACGNQENKKIESKLFQAADKLRKNIDAAEYKHIVLGLIFLKYISDSFEALREKLENEKGADVEDKEEYKAENVFWVPPIARWSHLHAEAKQATIGKTLDEAMEMIEKENPSLKDVLPKVFARQQIDQASLGQLIDLVGDIALGDDMAASRDALGRVYEYFLGEFASAEGKKGGQFYTPRSIVQLMVGMIEPKHGRVYDPACGSGGMFVHSEDFVKDHQGRTDDIAVYGQESNHTTYRLAKMNLAIRGIESDGIAWNNEGSFLKDAHPDLKADFILANPPFNQSDWGQDILQNDPRWKYGLPPAGNANFGWMQHMIYHLAPNGVMAMVLANGSLVSNTSGEGEIRKNIVDADLVDCIVALPKQLFYNTGIPATLWFISRKRTGNGDRKRTGEVLFIDASEMGYMEDRTHRAFTDEDMNKISNTYKEWRKKDSSYEDVKGFCKSANIEEIQKHKYVLTAGRYVGIPDEVDDGIPFEDKMADLTKTFKVQIDKEQKLNKEIEEQLKKVGFKLR